MSISFAINPFTTPAGKISGLKSAHIHPSKQYIWRSYNKSTFSTVHFDRNPFTCSCKGGKKGLMISNLALLLVVFKVTVQQARQWKSSSAQPKISETKLVDEPPNPHLRQRKERTFRPKTLRPTSLLQLWSFFLETVEQVHPQEKLLRRNSLDEATVSMQSAKALTALLQTPMCSNLNPVHSSHRSWVLPDAV